MTQQYNEIQEEHQRIIEMLRDGANVNIQLAEEFLNKISRSGEEVGNPDDRAQLRALIRYWSSVIYDNTGRFPRIELQPYLQSSTNVLSEVSVTQTETEEGRVIYLLAPQQRRNRQAMLAKVKSIWITGFLEHSLAEELRITLDLAEHPDAVTLPLNVLVQELRHLPRSLPAGTPISEVFDTMGGALLILGAPGAGKTTLLLELARDLIARAEQDDDHPIPVIFNLASWAEKRLPLHEWLKEELQARYDVPRKLAQVWMDAEAVLPLLDGLDEVAAEQRNNCVEAINTYRQAHGLVPLAVCSRVADYEALTSRLQLQGAIVVQPLTRPQIDAYLERAGAKLHWMRTALHTDAVLGELLETPLMLSIAALAYQDTILADLVGLDAVNTRRHLFDHYIAAMFKRRSAIAHSTPSQTIHWLTWLASQLVLHSQSIFYIEQMQLDWLPQGLRRRYTFLVQILTGLIVGLVGGLGAGLVSGMSTGPSVGLVVGLGAGLVVGLGAGLGVGLGSALNYIRIVEMPYWSWSQIWRGLIVGLVGAVISGLGIGLVQGLVGRLVGGLLGGLIIGLGIGLSGERSNNKVAVITTPNQGIIRSTQSALVVAVIGGLVVGVASGLSGTLVDGLAGGLIGGLVGVLIGGLISGLQYGGLTVIQHYTLRWLLLRNSSLPLRLVPFLDHCVERILLRRVGGGYIFVHRLLMEHFASLSIGEQAIMGEDNSLL